MPRNVERDIEREKIRRDKLIEAGFRIFSERGIEAVNLQTIAKEAEVGIATFYNYYKNKTNFVVAVSAKIWSDYMREVMKKVPMEVRESRNAYEAIEDYCNEIINIYENRPDILRFSGNYKTYISRERPEKERIKEHQEVFIPIEKLFFDKFERAKTDKSIRTDIPMDVMLTTVCMTMLGMAERFAQGIVWSGYDRLNHLAELKSIKDMILMWVKDIK